MATGQGLTQTATNKNQNEQKHAYVNEHAGKPKPEQKAPKESTRTRPRRMEPEPANLTTFEPKPYGPKPNRTGTRSELNATGTPASPVPRGGIPLGP